MKRVLQLSSAVALVGIVVPPALFFRDQLTHEGMQTVMLLATVLWFAVTPFWMSRGS